jgi:hypothetical protein
LEALHAPLVDSEVVIAADDSIPVISLTSEPDDEEVDDVFPTPSMPHASFGVNSADGAGNSLDQEGTVRRLIVEALVVRKMSLEEGFLDFGGFALI